jgi:peptide/nickel transport system substrate-binding protein
MNNSFSLLRTFCLLSLLFVAVTACDQASTEQNSTKTFTQKDTLIVARASEPEWLNPVAGHQHADSDRSMFRGLFKLDLKNRLVPDMAESWSVSKDGKVYTIKLRNGIKWHDGVAFSAEDVKFTIESIQNPKNHSGLRKEVEEISSVEVIDPLTVQITLSQPLAPLPSRLKIGMIPKHALMGKDFNTDPFNFDQPVGTGPYKFKSRKPGEYLELVANPDFYGGAPAFERVIYKFLPDPNVRLVQLKKGEIDVAPLTPKQVAAVKSDDPFRIETTPSADYRVMMFNHRDPLFQDVRVRQAIQFSTDRGALVRGALLGYGSAAYGPLQFNRMSTAEAELLKHDNNIERAEQLLNEAGWQRGEDGMMYKDGNKFSFVLTAPVSDPVRVDLATLLASQLKRVGIETKVDVKDWAVISIPKTQSLILGGGLPGDPDDDLYRFFSSHMLDAGNNYSGYNNPRVDELLAEGRGALHEQQRVQIYQQLQRELTENPAYNYLVYLEHIYGVRKDVEGFQKKIFGHGTSPLWNIETWRLAGDD